MSESEKPAQDRQSAGGLFAFLWQRKLWWLPPLVVLVLLVAVLYVLGHLSAADPEMYPTTRLTHSANSVSC